jgi:hypothetical protein
LAGCKFFSKIDLVKGYYQIPVAADDVPKTAILTPFGLYEFLFMPFGLRNAAQSFQRMMDKVFAGLPFVFIDLDDILIASATFQDHQKHLRQVFSLLVNNGLRINADKCVFFSSSGQFRNQAFAMSCFSCYRVSSPHNSQGAAAVFGPGQFL